MNYELKKGFSLAEVLIAVGIFAVAMMFIAGVFPVGIHFTTVSIERTTAAVIADEAFAKIKLYGIDISSSKLKDNELNDFNSVNLFPDTEEIPIEEFTTTTEANMGNDETGRTIVESCDTVVNLKLSDDKLEEAKVILEHLLEVGCLMSRSLERGIKLRYKLNWLNK